MDWRARSTRNPSRVGVVGAVGAVRSALEALDTRPEVRDFPDLYGSAAALAEFAPQLLVAAAGSEFEQDLGALRVLRGMLPELALILSAEGGLSAERREVCAAHGVVVCDPDRDLPHFAEVVARALGEGGEPHRYLEFVQGICDEINNPLMFASGHLQLLESRLDPQDDRDPLAQVAAIRAGLARIQATMQKVGAMGRASDAARRGRPFTVDAVVRATEERIRAAGLAVDLACADDARAAVLRGDLELVTGALFGLCQVGAELDSGDAGVVLQVRRGRTGVALQMEVRNPRLEDWELPRAFEPYHLNEVLRGTSLGLNLFLVRLVTRAHGWDAFARRLLGPRVEFCIGPAPAANGHD